MQNWPPKNLQVINTQDVAEILDFKSTKRFALLGRGGDWIVCAWGIGSIKPFQFKDFFNERDFFSGGFSKVKKIHWHEWKDLVSKKSELQAHKVNFIGLDFSIFEKYFQQIKNEISNQKIKKAVPVLVNSGSFSSDFKFEDFLFKLVNIEYSDNNWIFGLFEDGQSLLGQSPEILFEINGLNLKTMALAGTADISRSDEDFLSDPKERKEHQLVVDTILSKLSALGVFSQQPTQVLKLKFLKHLKTDFSIKLSNKINFNTVLNLLHPTPALGSLPNDFDFLKKIRQTGSEFLGAPLVFTFESYTLAIVAIRFVQIDKTKLVIPVGCGIVEASRLDDEFSELGMKTLSVLRSFQYEV